MSRVATLLAVIAILLTELLSGAPVPFAAEAQEATPGTEDGPPAGIAFEAVAYAPVDSLPPVPAIALIDRVTLAPGAGLPGDAGSPNFSIIVIESGMLTIRTDAPLTITRADAIATALATPGTLPQSEQTAAGSDVTLTVGDSAAWPPLVGGELRNDGAEPVVVLAVSIAPAEAVTGTESGAAATP